VFDAGTINQRTTYSDNALTVPNAHPIVADGEGRFGSIYIGVDTPNDWKFSLTDSADVVIQTADNITGPLDTSGFLTGTVSPARAVTSITTTTTLTATEDGKQVNADPSGGNFTVTLRSAVDMGDGGDVLIKNSGTAGIVTVAAAGGQNIDGETARSLFVGDSAVMRSDGANFTVGEGYDFTSGDVTVAFSSTVDIDVSLYPSGVTFIMVATSDFTLTTSGDRRGHAFSIIIRQDATGGHVATLDSKFIGDFQPDIRPFALTRIGVYTRTLATLDFWHLQPVITGVPDVIVENQQTQNTGGGSTTVSASWQDVIFNTEVYDPKSIVTLSSNRTPLAVGTYYTEWDVPGYQCNEFQTALYNWTGASVIKEGSTEYQDSTDPSQSRSIGSEIFTLTTADTVGIAYKAARAQASNGFGRAGNLSTEVYGRWKIWRIG